MCAAAGSGLEEITAQVQAVRRKREAELLSKANVVGLGVGYRRRHGQPTNELALIVLVREKVPWESLAPHDRIPQELDGVPVDVQDVGELRALGN
jgi:hypothetical protein